MELNTYFSMLVLSICTMHLASKIDDQIFMRWRPFELVRNFLYKSAARYYTPASSATKKQRSDWYVFFHCADLVGKEPFGDQMPSRKFRAGYTCTGKKYLQKACRGQTFPPLLKPIKERKRQFLPWSFSTSPAARSVRVWQSLRQ